MTLLQEELNWPWWEQHKLHDEQNMQQQEKERLWDKQDMLQLVEQDRPHD